MSIDKNEASVARPWGSSPVTEAECAAFAKALPTSVTSHERGVVARDLAAFPPQIAVRGVFFEGVSRIIAQGQRAGSMAELCRRGQLPEHTTPFRFYPLRDFYKLYYLVAPVLHPRVAFPEALRRTARNFFPIFRESLVGKTIAALMGDRPQTILPLLSNAYRISVEGNEHRAELVGDRELAWECRVESVAWYVETFSGILEGTVPEGSGEHLSVTLRDRAADGAGFTRYRFQIRW